MSSRARKRRGDKSGTGPGEAFEKWQAEPGETQLMRKDNEETSDIGKSEREFEWWLLPHGCACGCGCCHMVVPVVGCKTRALQLLPACTDDDGFACPTLCVGVRSFCHTVSRRLWLPGPKISHPS